MHQAMNKREGLAIIENIRESISPLDVTVSAHANNT